MTVYGGEERREERRNEQQLQQQQTMVHRDRQTEGRQRESERQGERDNVDEQQHTFRFSYRIALLSSSLCHIVILSISSLFTRNISERDR